MCDGMPLTHQETLEKMWIQYEFRAFDIQEIASSHVAIWFWRLEDIRVKDKTLVT